MSLAPALRVALEAAVHDGTPGDVAFYAEACAGAARVLELGCGTGRVAAALAGAGHRVVGLDVDADAVAAAAARGLEVCVGDMRDFALGARFERVLVPFSGLYCLLREAEVVRCLERVRAHLAPAGELVLDAYGADVFHDQPEDETVDDEDLVATVRVDETDWEVLERSRWWRRHQRIDAWYRYVPADGREAHEQCIRQRYLLSEQVPELLARAGLRLETLAGGFAGEPWHPGAELMVVRAVAA